MNNLLVNLSSRIVVHTFATVYKYCCEWIWTTRVRGLFPLMLRSVEYTEKIYSSKITEYFGNWGYEKNLVDFTELYSKITRTVPT